MKKLSIENPFFEFMGRIGDIMITNILFLICSVPVVTMGASIAAMYKVFGEMEEDTYISAFKTFREAFISSLRKSIPVWLLSFITGAVLVFDLMFVTKAQGSFFWHMTGMVTGCLMFLWLLLMCWLFPAALFRENTLKEAIKKSMFLAVRNFPYALLMVILDLIPVICFILGDYYAALVAPLYFVAGFGVTALKYSNNIQWENVDVAGIAEEIIPLPVSIANDADCAVLGEAVAGAGRGYKNVVLLTLGTGAGGGVTINGKLYEGGSEPGHMVIKKDGELCTCGRKGCLEAYVSSAAIKRETKKAFGREVPPEELSRLAKDGDETAVKVLSDYIEALGTGIVNIANVLRPELILVGGGIASNNQIPLEPLREMLAKNCFGGGHGVIPKLEMATLGNKAGMAGAAALAAGSDM